MKADKGTRLSLFVTCSGASGLQCRSDETSTNWQTLTVDFVQPANSMDAAIGLSCGKVPPNYSTWIDTISIRELSREGGAEPEPATPQVKTAGTNQMPEKTEWRAVNSKLATVTKECIKFSSVKDGATMLTAKVQVPVPGKWQFTAMLPPGCAIRITPAGQKMIKANGDQPVYFTTGKPKETVQIQFWLPPAPAGTQLEVNKMSLLKTVQ